MALAHPKAFPLVASRPVEAPWLRPPLRSLTWVEAFLDGLIAEGFSDEAAVAAYRAFTSFLLGHLLLEVAMLGADVGPLDVLDDGESATSGRWPIPTVHRLGDSLAENHSAQRVRGGARGAAQPDRADAGRDLSRSTRQRWRGRRGEPGQVVRETSCSPTAQPAARDDADRGGPRQPVSSRRESVDEVPGPRRPDVGEAADVEVGVRADAEVRAVHVVVGVARTRP